MPKYIDGKLYNIISYENDTPIEDQPAFLEACSKYDIVDFTHHLYNHPIDSLPNNIKFINLAKCNVFDKILKNLPYFIL